MEGRNESGEPFIKTGTTTSSVTAAANPYSYQLCPWDITWEKSIFTRITISVTGQNSQAVPTQAPARRTQFIRPDIWCHLPVKHAAF